MCVKLLAQCLRRKEFNSFIHSDDDDDDDDEEEEDGGYSPIGHHTVLTLSVTKRHPQVEGGAIYHNMLCRLSVQESRTNTRTNCGTLRGMDYMSGRGPEYFICYDQRGICMWQTDSSETIQLKIGPKVYIAVELVHKTIGMLKAGPPAPRGAERIGQKLPRPRVAEAAQSSVPAQGLGGRRLPSQQTRASPPTLMALGKQPSRTKASPRPGGVPRLPRQPLSSLNPSQFPEEPPAPRSRRETAGGSPSSRWPGPRRSCVSIFLSKKMLWTADNTKRYETASSATCCT
ncbi:PREDICTED: uncharacterized protein LOC103601426 [Galeopterus variegatus]|uniref:Uncharacterized protein LOC103601426 n=1 Tax=Galeopterus variegatus TaxID=482537 RepID=A0ABM0RTW4_GALVR|nr:PREDICTED: uncharacterized protein LOC103601426 [Galeopterus variegatus]